jgi:ppGpp synthetase/RelA/SpoT-type nucleotidyltranferase
MDIRHPASAEAIEQFVTDNRGRYIKALNEVKELILREKRERKDLRCIYNLYSRGDKQSGNELKHPNKIRLKFDSYCSKEKLKKANIFDSPDIVGITVSVTYPSDINIVCAFLDDLCKREAVFPKFFNLGENEKTNEKSLIKIKTSSGSVKNESGYYACHYYLRTNDDEDDPIVEVQIKTVLHDAWSLKTHDLTYKNLLTIDKSTRNNFILLGDALSYLDMQSDFLRRSIRKSHAFREATKRAIKIELIMHGAGSISVSEVVSRSSTEPKAYVETLRKLVNGTHTVNSEKINALRKKAISFCTKITAECGCVLLCALAVITEDTQAQLDALDRIYIWESKDKNNISPKIHKHLANYYFGNTGGAIDAAESALKYLRKIKKNDSVTRKINSLVSSLAYYYAELIGTDEGNKREAHKQAIYYRDESKSQLRDMEIIDDATKDWPKLIIDLLGCFDSIDPNDHKLLSDIFNVIDNAIFVEIQTANKAKTAKEALNWLDRLKSVRPEALVVLAERSHDLHTHYARLRLLELEAQEAGSILTDLLF